MRGKKLPPGRVEQCRRRALEEDLARYLRQDHELRWKPEEIALVGTMPDEEVAGKVGRSVKAVTVARLKRGIPAAVDRRRRPETY